MLRKCIRFTAACHDWSSGFYSRQGAESADNDTGFNSRQGAKLAKEFLFQNQKNLCAPCAFARNLIQSGPHTLLSLAEAQSTQGRPGVLVATTLKSIPCVLGAFARNSRVFALAKAQSSQRSICFKTQKALCAPCASARNQTQPCLGEIMTLAEAQSTLGMIQAFDSRQGAKLAKYLKNKTFCAPCASARNKIQPGSKALISLAEAQSSQGNPVLLLVTTLKSILGVLGAFARVKILFLSPRRQARQVV